MTDHSLYDNSTITWEPQNQSEPIVFGVRFQSSSGGYLKAVRWRRAATGGIKPSLLAIYDSTGPAIIQSFSPAPENGAVGWKQTNLAAPIALTSSHTYAVVALLPLAGNILGQASAASYTAASSPLLLDDNRRFYALQDTLTYPTNGQLTSLIGLDFVWSDDPTPITGDPETQPTTTGDLADWLSVADNTKGNDSAPVHVEALATGASGFDAIKAVADAVAAAVSGLPGTIAAAVTTITGQLTALVGTVVDTSTVTIGRIIHDLAAVTINTQDTLLDLAKLSEGAGSFPSDLGTLVWTMLDETDFVGEIAWAQPAEVYVLSITTRPIGLPLNLTDGVHTIYRCGWWSPLNGSFARQRSYIDFEDNHLTIGGERMPGILVSLQPGGEGHLQAWALT